MRSLWAVAVAGAAWLSVPASAFVPEFLSSDLPALFARFKISHVHNGSSKETVSITFLKVVLYIISKINKVPVLAGEFLASHEFKAEVRAAAGELRVFVDSVRCAEVTLGRPNVGAVFYPAALAQQPCAADVTRKVQYLPWLEGRRELWQLDFMHRLHGDRLTGFTLARYSARQ